jgi:hypothetical protein
MRRRIKIKSDPKRDFAGPSNQGNCGVTAIATIAKVPFHVVMAYLREKYKRTLNWEGSTFPYEQQEALTHFGVKWERLKVSEWDGLSLHCFAKFVAKEGVAYMVNTKSHTMVFKDGAVMDQNVSDPVLYFEHMGGGYKNQTLYQVVEIKSAPTKADRLREMEREKNELRELF